MYSLRAIAALFYLCTTLIASDIIYTVRNNNYLREGPASYFTLVEIVPIGTKLQIIDKKENWLKVKCEGKIGWIAKNCLSESEPDKSMAEKLTKTWSSTKASKTGIAAAIKGWDKKTGKDIAGDVDLLLKLTSNTFTDKQFSEFKSTLLEEKSSNKNRSSISSLNLDVPYYDPLIKELHIGTGVASRIIARGVVRDKQIMDYVNMICQAIVESSIMYDWDFSVLIVNDNKINGYACPGGYIFITKEAFLKCSDEAELASIIAHEAAHIVRRHGLQEMTQRKVQIKADDAFAELDQELQSASDSVSSELEQMMVSSYEKIMHERLLAYETEADLIASVLIANAGYDPFGIVRATKVLYQLSKEPKDIFDDDYLAPDNAKIRYEKINGFVNDNFVNQSPGAKSVNRFLQMKERLR